MILDCVTKQYEEFYQREIQPIANCTIPWTLSLLKTATNDTISENPCENPRTATLITYKLQEFFTQANNYSIDQCTGIL